MAFQVNELQISKLQSKMLLEAYRNSCLNFIDP